MIRAPDVCSSREDRTLVWDSQCCSKRCCHDHIVGEVQRILRQDSQITWNAKFTQALRQALEIHAGCCFDARGQPAVAKPTDVRSKWPNKKDPRTGEARGGAVQDDRAKERAELNRTVKKNRKAAGRLRDNSASPGSPTRSRRRTGGGRSSAEPDDRLSGSRGVSLDTDRGSGASRRAASSSLSMSSKTTSQRRVGSETHRPERREEYEDSDDQAAVGAYDKDE